MPHPGWYEMSNEQKMDFLYDWCAQVSAVVQELRSMNQTLMDKVIEIEAAAAVKYAPPSS
jgi:hypothetical protein